MSPMRAFTAVCRYRGMNMLARLPRYIVWKASDGLVVNLYATSTTETRFNDVAVRIEQETDYPRNGRIRISFVRNAASDSPSASVSRLGPQGLRARSTARLGRGGRRAVHPDRARMDAGRRRGRVGPADARCDAARGCGRSAVGRLLLRSAPSRSRYSVWRASGRHADRNWRAKRSTCVRAARGCGLDADCAVRNAGAGCTETNSR